MTRGRVGQWLANNAIYLLLVVALLVAWQASPSFSTLIGLQGTLTTASVNLLVVAGLSLVLICGEIDLTVGSMVGLGSMIAVGTQDALGPIPAAMLAVLAGAFIGAISGVLVAKVRVASILVTLGGMITVNGIAQSLANGQTVSANGIGPSIWIQETIAGLFTPTSLIAIGVVVVLQLILWQTPVGRAWYLIGGSDDRGRFSGIRTDLLLISAFVISGATAALGGVVLGIGLNTGSPAFGDTTLFVVIAAAVVGGTSLFGAEGSVAKSALGVLFLAVISTAMTDANVASWAQNVVNGSILVIVLLIDSTVRRHAKRLFQFRIIERGRQSSQDDSHEAPSSS
jgi:ribose transport system permease protein